MKKLNLVIAYSPDGRRVLMCRRARDPDMGKLNFVGGKVEPGEGDVEAAYRELLEETGIGPARIRLTRVMNFQYFLSDIELQVFAGRLPEDAPLREEKNALLWVERTEDFSDTERFAGERNIEHMLREAELFREQVF